VLSEIVREVVEAYVDGEARRAWEEEARRAAAHRLDDALARFLGLR
jgi:hypothetical protein